MLEEQYLYQTELESRIICKDNLIEVIPISLANNENVSTTYLYKITQNNILKHMFDNQEIQITIQ